VIVSESGIHSGAMADQPRHVLIIGGGFAGLACAKGLANDPRFAVTLVDRTNHHLFQPLLYQVATASLAAPDIARSIRQILARANNVTVLMEEITEIDPRAQRAISATGHTYDYDFLVLAAGARTGYFGHDEWEPHTMGLKTLVEAQNIRRKVLTNLESAEIDDAGSGPNQLMTVAIVGGGPTGVELAGALADLVRRSLKSNFRHIDTSRLRIVLIEAGDRILPAYEVSQSDYARRRLENLGVEVHTGAAVTSVEEGRLTFGEADTALEAAAIIWAAGTAASPLTACLGVPLDRGGRVTPEPDLSVPGYPRIFVAGDVVRLLKDDGTPVPNVAPAAMQMGSHIAEILRKGARKPFRYLDKGIMAIIGKNHAVVRAGGLKINGYIAWLAWLFVHIAFLVGFRNKLAVMLGWAWAYLVNNPEARIIVNPPCLANDTGADGNKAPGASEDAPADRRPR